MVHEAFHLGELGIFLAMIGGALLLGKTPFGRPLACAEVYYHELSHGLMTLLTGGMVERITLDFRGGGRCTTRGGWRVPVLLAGYAGASLWGGLLYMVGHKVGVSGAETWLMVEVGVIALSILLWCRNFSTLVILLFLGGLYAAAFWLPNAAILPWLMKFLGIYVMLNAIRAPLNLIDGQSIGDGAELAKIVFLPEFVWITLWFGFALLVLAECAAWTVPGVRGVLSFLPF